MAPLTVSSAPASFHAAARSVARTLAVILALSVTALSAHADLAEIQKKGVFKVATEDDYQPFNFIQDGKPVGFHADMLADLQKFMAKKSVKVQQEILPWTGLLASVAAGQYDMAYTGALVTEERLKVFNFAPPFASAQHFYIKRAGDKSLGDIPTLSGKTVGVQAGSALLARLPELEAMLKKVGGKLGKVVEYPSYPEAMADLANGRLDYVIDAVVPANTIVAAKPKVFAKGVAVSGGGFAAWPIPKNNPELLKLMTEFMTELRKSGRLAELQKKWFGEAFPALPTEPITNFDQFKKLAGM